MVKPFIIDITASSTTKTVSHVDLSIEEGEPVSVSLSILDFQRLFKVLTEVMVPLVCPIMSKEEKVFKRLGGVQSGLSSFQDDKRN